MVCISGSRSFTERIVIDRMVEALIRDKHWVLVGDARGADAMVRRRLEQIGATNKTVFEADWATEGRSAGHKRNARMIAEADTLVAFFAPGDRTPGTSSAVRMALAKGIPVRIYHEGKWSNGTDA